MKTFFFGENLIFCENVFTWLDKNYENIFFGENRFLVKICFWWIHDFFEKCWMPLIFLFSNFDHDRQTYNRQHTNYNIFYHGPKLVRQLSCGHPLGTSLIDSFNRQEQTCASPAEGQAAQQSMNHMLCNCYGVGNISKHYRVGHGIVPCQPRPVFEARDGQA